ncbi:acyclic terpene utilization AtuA family protein [Streptomyces sp. NPDC002537]
MVDPVELPSEQPLRIGNASGFYGDRFDALREMLTGGPLDVLTGDYLAELTMLILGRDRLKDPRRGYAKTFLAQLEEGLGLAVDRGVKLVANAGGLNPAGLAQEIRALADRLGIPVRVAHVEGDDLLAERDWGPGVLTANAYLGGAGIAACLRAGADVVVTGRVTDAALVTGPATAHFGWLAGDLDRLAGAVVAGHVLECGTQATGGNYSFFRELPAGHGPHRPGFPLAEIHADGSAVITKHPGTGGAVTVGTVTAQLLYETGGPRYLGPDVTARLDTVRLTEDGPDRVRISGVRGEAPPPSLKTGLTRVGGWRNEVVFVLTGLDIEAKAGLVREQLEAAMSRRRPAEVRWTLARTDHPDAAVQEEASAFLRLVVRDPDPEAVGRALSGAAVELALSSYPGFHVTAPPGKGMPYGVFDAVYVDAFAVRHVAVLPDGTRVRIPACAGLLPDGFDRPTVAACGGGRPVPGASGTPAAGRLAACGGGGLRPRPQSPDGLDCFPDGGDPADNRPADPARPAIEDTARQRGPGPGAEPRVGGTGAEPRVAGTGAEPRVGGSGGLPPVPGRGGVGEEPAAGADRPAVETPAFARPARGPGGVGNKPAAGADRPAAEDPASARPARGPDGTDGTGGTGGTGGTDGTGDTGEKTTHPPEARKTRRAPLGEIVGARSGDKGGTANVGIWVRTDRAWQWLANELTTARFRELLPETADFAIERHPFPNLRALNFTIDGLLGEGVASQARFDPQAKALGEWLRARHMDIPEELL